MKTISIPPANIKPMAQSANVYDSGSSLLAPSIGGDGVVVLAGRVGVTPADTTEMTKNGQSVNVL